MDILHKIYKICVDYMLLVMRTFNLKSPVFLESPKSDYLMSKFSMDRIIKLQINFYKLFIIMLFWSHSLWISLFFLNLFLNLELQSKF